MKKVRGKKDTLKMKKKGKMKPEEMGPSKDLPERIGYRKRLAQMKGE